MGKIAHHLLFGALTGILTLICTYILGTIHHGFYLAIVYLKWWIMCLSMIIPLLLLTATTIHFNKNISCVLTVSGTSGIVFMIVGGVVIFYKQPITKCFYNFFPTKKHFYMIGYSSYWNIFIAGIFLVAIVLGYLIVIQKLTHHSVQRER
ncbi:MAG: hypothetical protein K0Q73_8042 [Paenibacillus sp.]|nr:hypothetical protein [Paenibacillus sp.]